MPGAEIVTVLKLLECFLSCYIGITMSVHPSVYISCKHNSSFTDELINIDETLDSCSIWPEDVHEFISREITSNAEHRISFYAPLRRREGILLCTCRSVCLSVTFLFPINNSRTPWPTFLKLGPHICPENR